jgi:hypothetical protein
MCGKFYTEIRFPNGGRANDCDQILLFHYVPKINNLSVQKKDSEKQIKLICAKGNIIHAAHQG